MDADEYELDYEAESPPRHSQHPVGIAEEEPVAASIEPAEESDANALSDGAYSDAETNRTGIQPTNRSDHDTRSVASVVVSKGRKRPLQKEKEASLVAALMRKLKQYKKTNAELHHQLQKFYQNEAIAFLENKAQDRQRQVDALTQENRTLVQQHRVLSRQVEELQDAVESVPAKRVAEREELRVCREQLRFNKDKQKLAEEKATKMHQQAVDLATLNKSLVEQVAKLESELSPASPSQRASHRSATALGQEEAEAIIASQEDEITRLRHRVDVMKKANKLERAKFQKESQAAKDELEKACGDLERYHQQVFDKEKLIRSQFLEIKQLKRSLKDAVAHMQVNQQLHHASGGRDVRFANQHQHHHQHQSLYKAGPGGSGAHELLSRLGMMQLTHSPSKASSVHLSATDSSTSFAPRPPEYHHNSQSIRHAPCPPHGSPRDKHPKSTPRNSARGGHAQLIETKAATPRTASSRRELLIQSTAPSACEAFYEDVDNSTFQSLAAEAATTLSHDIDDACDSEDSSL